MDYDYKLLATLDPDTARRPQGGDLVRLASNWAWGGLPLGKLGTIQGQVGRNLEPHDWASIIFATYSFRGRSCEPGDSHWTAHWADFPIYASTSGGPGTIETPMWQLLPSTERLTVTCWKWKSIPIAHGGIDFRVELPVWLWFPNDEQ